MPDGGVLQVNQKGVLTQFDDVYDYFYTNAFSTE